jgi:Cyclophilin type peptidyl-prolyl cis-trans isomerase/CLD
MVLKVLPVAVLLCAVTTATGFAPRSFAKIRSTTELGIGGLLQGIFGKTEAEITDTVFFDIAINGDAVGRIEMGLYGSIVPRTAANFKQLCDGTQGFGYKGSGFHRIIPGFMCQAGDFTNGMYLDAILCFAQPYTTILTVFMQFPRQGMALAASLSTARALTMKTLTFPTAGSGPSQWPTQDRTRTVVSSLFVLGKLLGSTESTLCLER